MDNRLRNDPRYQNHVSRPDLAGEHPVGDTYQLIAMIVFIFAVLLDYLFLGFPQKYNSSLSIWARLPLSMAIFVLGGWLALRGIRIVFGEYREKPIMITKHLFGWIRHPIYLGTMLIYVAVLLLVLSPLGVLAFIGVLGLYHWLAKDEEKRMLGIFGEKYRAYMQRVPMWLPYKFGKND